MSTLASNEIPLDPEEKPGCLVCCYQDLAGGTRNDYAGKTNLSLAPAKRKKKHKTQTQQTKTPSFLPANLSGILKGNITKNFSLLLLCHLSSLLYLFFTCFMEVSPSSRTGSQSRVLWRPQNRAVYFLVWRSISGEKLCPHSDPNQL